MQANERLRSIMLMLLAVGAFAMGDVLMKVVMKDLSMWQAIFIRAVPASVILAVLVTHERAWAVLRNAVDRRMILLRSLAELGAAMCFIGALRHMPVANLTAVMQALPLCVTLAAALLFGESLGWRRIVAISVGFVGVMIVVRPGPEGFDLWALVGLGSMSMVVLRELITRKMNPRISPALSALAAIILVGLPGAAGTAVMGWQPMSSGNFALLLLGSVLLPLAFMGSIKALQCGEIGVTAPFRYTQLLWAVLFGFVLIGDLPDFWTFVGAALTIASGVFTILREASSKPRKVVALS